MDTEGAIRVLVIDDHPSIHTGLELVIGDAPGLSACGFALDGTDGLAQAARERPDVCVVDIRMPGTGGIAVLRQLPAGTASLVYSAYGDRRLMSEAIDAGARGYVLKSSPVGDLLRAIHAVAAGRPYVDPGLSPLLMADTVDEEPALAGREREVLMLLAGGLRMQDVADRLDLTHEQVKGEARRATERLRATGRVHAVATALRLDLIE